MYVSWELVAVNNLASFAICGHSEWQETLNTVEQIRNVTQEALLQLFAFAGLKIERQEDVMSN